MIAILAITITIGMLLQVFFPKQLTGNTRPGKLGWGRLKMVKKLLVLLCIQLQLIIVVGFISQFFVGKRFGSSSRCIQQGKVFTHAVAADTSAA